MLIFNIGELVTCQPLAHEKRVAHIKPADLGRVQNAWLYVEDGKVRDFGTMPVPERYAQEKNRLNANGGLILPGLVDSHTHPLFAGSRFREFAQRLAGLSYQEIAEQGGGIKSTVNATRAASADDLAALAHKRLTLFASWGTTTVEVKSGYGLSVEEELRHLQVLRQVQKESRLTLRVTCLALHAVPPEHRSAKSYADVITRELLPKVAAGNLADAVDAFVERGYFAVSDCEGYVAKARELGIAVRLHADEFSDAGAAAAAAHWGAYSADHLQFASDEGVRAMADAQVVATVLPGTSLYTAIPFASGKRLASAGCPVAIASDYNPGSCQIPNLPLLASLAGLHGGLTPEQIIAGLTYVPAYSLRLHASKGALAVGYDADFLLHPASCVDEWLADLGQTQPSSVWIAGTQTTT